MQAKLLLNQIYNLPFEEKLFLIEKTIQSIKKQIPKQSSLGKAAKLLLSEYQNNKELTVFTGIDHEDFYEAR